MRDVRVRLEEGDENGSKCWIFVCQLEGEGGEDEVQVAAVSEIARTKERCPQHAVSEDPLANCLGDRGLSGASQPIQPEDGRLLEVFDPRLDLVQDSLPCTPEAALSISMLVPRPRSAAAVVQH